MRETPCFACLNVPVAFLDCLEAAAEVLASLVLHLLWRWSFRVHLYHYRTLRHRRTTLTHFPIPLPPLPPSLSLHF